MTRMTRYPVHVGSIPAYQLAEMDRINEPYRKERAMADDPGEREAAPTLRELEAADPFAPHDPGCHCWPHVSQRAAIEGAVQAATAEYREKVASPDPVSEPVEPEDACRHGYMTGTFCSECPGEVAVRPVNEPVDVGMSFTNRPDVGNIPTVSESVDPTAREVKERFDAAFPAGLTIGSIVSLEQRHITALNDVEDFLFAALPPVSEPVDGLREAIDAVADALNGWDQGEEPREDTHRHWSRIVAALAAAPAEERGVDVERLAAALLVIHSWDEYTAKSEARDVAREYDRLAARQSGDPR